MVPKFPVHPEDPIYMGAEFLIMPLYTSRQAQTNLARQLGKEGKSTKRLRFVVNGNLSVAAKLNRKILLQQPFW